MEGSDQHDKEAEESPLAHHCHGGTGCVVKIFSIGGVAGTVLYLAAYLIIGYDILRKAFRGIIKGQVFDENFLMAVAPWVPLHWPSTRKAATIWRPWP